MAKVKKRNYKNGDSLINLSVLILCAFGVIMVGSASTGSVASYGFSYALEIMIKHFLFICTGWICILFFTHLVKVKYINPTTINFLYWLFVVLMLVCLFWEINGSRAWIKIPYLGTIQPAEFMKVILVLLLSFYFTVGLDSFTVKVPFSNQLQKDMFFKQKFNTCVIKPLFAVLLVVFIGLFLQNDTGTVLIILLMSLFVLFTTTSKYYSKYKMIIKILLILIGIVLFISVLFDLPFLQLHQMQRFNSWFNPLDDPLNTSYQLVNSLIAFSNGGFWGLGLGSSTQKYGYIPECHNDFIGAIICEELGIFGLLIITLATLMIIKRLLFHATKIKNPTAKLILVGISSYFFIHFFVNLGGISGMIPMTGVPLLLVSSGGSSILSAMFGISIAQVIIKHYNT